MDKGIKERISIIRQGEIPQGYKIRKLGILPNSWQEIRLKDIAVHITKKNTDNSVSETFTNSATQGVIRQVDYFEKQISNSENTTAYYVVEKSDYIYNPRVSSSAPCGPINKSNFDERGIVSPLYTVFRLQNEFKENKYIESYLHSAFWHRYMYSVANYGARHDRMNITNHDFFGMPVPLPPLYEQEKIAEIITTCDKVIELKEKLIEEKKRQKKWLMEKLLNPNSNIRLQQFNEPWKKYCIGDLGKSYTGLSGKTKDNFGKGVPYIPYVNIFFNPIVNNEAFECVEVFENEFQNKVRYGDVFFTTSSENPEEVGMSAVYLGGSNELYLNSFCFGLRFHSFTLILPEFAAYYFRSNTIRKILCKLAQGSTRYNLSANEFLKEYILIPPTVEEQKAIYNVIYTCDNELKILEKELDEWTKKKKALTQLLLTGIVRVNKE